MDIMFYIGSMYKGGAERVVSNLSNYLSHNHKIGIIVNQNEESSYSLNKKIKIIELNQNRKKSFLMRNILSMLTLKKAINSYQPRVIVCFLNGPSMKALLLKKLHLIGKKTKLLISVRNDPKELYKNFFKRMFMKILFKKADGFIFQTTEAKEYFNKQIQEKSIVIPNPINKEFIIPPYNGKREKTIVNVGRLMPQKNHKLLLKAFSIIEKEYSDFVLKIYGDGELKKELIDFSKELKINQKVMFMGNVQNIRDEIYKASLFVLSSDYEGMPNALMEAMSLGIPCISSDCPCGGPRFLIKNNYNGLLFKVGDSKELSVLIKKVLDDSDFAQKIGQNARKITEDLEPDKVNKIWEGYILKYLL